MPRTPQNSINQTYTLHEDHVTMIETVANLTGINKSSLVRKAIELLYAKYMPASATVTELETATGDLGAANILTDEQEAQSEIDNLRKWLK